MSSPPARSHAGGRAAVARLETRYEEARPSWVLAAIVFGLAGTFVADFVTPLGYAVWIFYLVPVGLCLYAVSTTMPVAVATSASVLLLAGLFLSSANSSSVLPFAQVNRSIGFLVIWGVALLTRQVNSARAALRREDWLRAAQNELARAAQGSQRLEELGSNLLTFLAEYLGAQYGVVYSLDGKVLRQAASYAHAGEGASPTRFALGEGLVGQVALNQKLIQLSDVPADHAPVRSGLLSTHPRHLLIAPVFSEGELNGVVELGFLQPCFPDDSHLLTLLAEPIGVALRGAVYRTKLEDLLEETRRQAEELQAQQEELRSTNEELEAQSTELKAQAVTLEAQYEELTRANEELEEHTHVLTEQRNNLSAAQRELARKAAEVETASRYKSEFLANMSHELRTPLNSALILSKLLSDNRNGNLTAEQIKYANSIYAAGNDLLELINDVLDLAKVEAGKMDVVVDRVFVQKLSESLQSIFQPIAREKELTFAVEVDPTVAKAIETDSQRLKQILKNLLSNAIKFTEQGRVELRVFPMPGDCLGFEVSDSGIGIPLEQQDVIFEAFRQADGTTNRKYGGTGLGLSIAREFARLLGGDLTVQSSPGVGSKFLLVIPQIWAPQGAPEAALPAWPTASAKPAAPTLAESVRTSDGPSRLARARVEPRAAVRSRSSVPPARVDGARAHPIDDRDSVAGESRVLLIIEDDPAFAQILLDLGRELGFAVMIGTTAAEGLELALRHRPQAIVLDMNLPDYSGLTVLDELKRTPATRHIPVQVASVSDYTQVALEMGAIGYMLKPVMRERLAEALSGLGDRFGARARNVLVVEDDELQRSSICDLLGAQDVVPVPVASSRDALAALRTASYDCMVLDLHLPDGSGFELLERMAEDGLASFPPVIIYTGRSLSSDEEQRLRTYSSSIIIKGARSPERLLDEVTLFLHQVEENLPPQWQRMLHDVRHRELAFEQRHVLLVEDDIRNVFAISSILEPRKVKVQVARNGQEALNALAKNPHFDVVLMDVMMPEMDGLTAMREIRLQPHLRKLPIIALTAKAMPDDQRACLDAGANDYIAKPLDVDRLLSLMRVWMPRRLSDEPVQIFAE
jgi:CheY-like chemotaxis protein/signal transduction histidine kinase